MSSPVKPKRKGAPKGHPKWGGRQKGTPNKSNIEARMLFEPHVKRAKQIVIELMEQKDDPDLQLRATQIVHDRYFGRPAQQTNLAGHDGGPLDLASIDDEALDAAIARLAAVASQETK